MRPEKASGDVTTMGQSSAEHPLLGAATPLAESDAFLLTGRLSLTEAGWLGDHAVFGTVLLPGTGLLELSFAAARAVGLTTVSQLTLVSPLVLPQRVRSAFRSSWMDLRAGWHVRGLSIYSRLEDAPAVSLDAACAGRAEFGGRSRGGGRDRARGMAACGREPIDLTGLYAALPARGYGYGPSFQGLREAWRVGDAVYGRVVLAEALSSFGG